MATLIAFRPSIGRYRFTSNIDGDQYVFKTRWNSLDAAWYFDLLEFDETPIVQGVKIVLGTYLARRSNHPLLLRGVFLARSNATRHVDATFDELGRTVNVYYFTRAEMWAEIMGGVSEAV